MADDNNLQGAVPVEDERRPLLAMLVDVEKPPPVAGPSMILVMVVFLWALFNAVLFAAIDIAIVILNFNPCTESWLFSCVTLTDEAVEEVAFLLCGEQFCSAAAAVHMLQKRRTTTTKNRRAATVVIVLLWVALASTVGIHGIYVASAHIVHASDPGNTVHFAFGYLCLALDLVAGVLLCFCSPRRRLEQLGEHQGGNKDGEV